MNEEKKRFARIKSNASQIFWNRAKKQFNVDEDRWDVSLVEQIPKTYIDFRKTLQNLANKEFEVDNEYNNRIVLKYPPELQKPFGKGKVVAIDLEKDLVEEIKK